MTALATTTADQCDDPLCALVRGHEGRHDPDFTDEPTAADTARRAAEQAAADRIAAARARPVTHVTVERAEQLGMFGGA